MNLEALSGFGAAGAEWLAAHGVRILLILVGAFVAQYLTSRFVDRLIRRLVPHGRGTKEKEAEEKRENTLIAVCGGTALIFIWIVAALMLLSEIGVAIGPLLAAMGIVGVAVGFGGQYLIRDVISGLFILIENQYRVGDVACFDKTCGLVEHISLRMTTLRDLDGTVHHVPHGNISRVSNLSKGFSGVNLDVRVSYASDLSRVIAVVNRVGKELADDPQWKEHIWKAPAFLRVNDFADSGIVIKITGQTAPLKQWEVTGELRLRLKEAFDAEGVEIPLPQRVVHTLRER